MQARQANKRGPRATTDSYEIEDLETHSCHLNMQARQKNKWALRATSDSYEIEDLETHDSLSDHSMFEDDELHEG